MNEPTINNAHSDADFSELLSAKPNRANADLKREVERAREAKERQHLQAELQGLREEMASSKQAANAMQQPDRYRVLKAKRKGKPAFVDLVMARLVAMFDVRPIIGSVIALGLLVLAFALVMHRLPPAVLHDYGVYINWVIGIAAGIVVIKSATRSLTLPVLAVLIGGLSRAVVPFHHSLFTLDAAFFMRMLIVGVVGLVMAAVTID